MTYADVFNKVKNTVTGKDSSGIEDMAVQVEITGEGEGIFYIQVQKGAVFVEPYDYKDNCAVIRIPSSELCRVCDGEIDFMTAFTLGRLEIFGDGKKASQLKKLFRKQ